MFPECPNCDSKTSKCSSHGYFVRTSDKKKFKRFRCNHCFKTFSQATSHRCYRQKKRRLNPEIRRLFNSCVSQRRIAKLLGISRTTVARKFRFLALYSKLDNELILKTHPKVLELQFDDLETFEHSKLKPLSVTMAVEKTSRKILGFRVSRMPAKGLIARRSRKKYGFREDERESNRRLLFSELKPKIDEFALIESDQSPHYPKSVREFFPKATHQTTKGRRGCVVGQGELKAGGFDPLFSLNHTFAMLRANINRLVRRTWCTTKLPERLEDHIHIYVNYHNTVLTKKSS